MKNTIPKIVSVAIAFTILGTGTVITKSVSPSSDIVLTAEAAITNPPKSNEQYIYDFLTTSKNDGGLGFDIAIACGVLSNIYYETLETPFNPEMGFNSTKGPVGICQWNNRRADLENYCTKNGMDCKTVEAQCQFIKYELENTETTTNTALNSIVKSGGNKASEAAKIWNEKYERSGKDSSTRSDKAKEIYNNYNNSLNQTPLYTGQVIINKLYVRKDASTNNSYVTALYKGAIVDVYNEITDSKGKKWGLISPRFLWWVCLENNSDLYVQKIGSSIEKKLPYTGIVVTNSSNTINIREKPTTNSNIVGSIAYGKPATILEISGNWARIETPVKGWVCLDYIKTNAPEIFNDVNSGEWYVDAINYVLNNNLMVGKGADKNSRKIYFGTDDILQREEFVQVLYNYEGKPDINGATIPFKDVQKGAWYYNAIVWAYTNNVVKGYSDDRFGVGDKLTREQLVQMLYNYANSCGYLRNYDPTSVKGLSGGFVDSSDISSWAQSAMDWAVSQGVMSYRKNNYGSSLLAPTSPASRAESADMIKNFVKKYK